ncbi:MAG TPA: hypothetical protein VJK54_02315 [Chthoniobacterales bacterium]|nr:hypothetical protein [Chthoniobacterales bacterium]
MHLFRNLPKDRFATKIPIYGTFSGPRAAILPTLGNILKNEFIRAYTGQFENRL